VITDEAGSSRREIPYDHLILALGSVSNYLGMANIEKRAFNFESLLDAIRIRNHIIEMFERADREPDPSNRPALLTFVIAGGGFTGVELAGAINDFAHGILADYPTLQPEEVRTVLVHSRDRILPELSESLVRYALQRMEARGVTFHLNTRLTDARPGVVVLSDGEIPAETPVWTAGTAPNPLVKSLPVEKSRRGAVIVEGMSRACARPTRVVFPSGARAPQAGALPFVCLCEPMQMNWMVVHDINRDLTGKAEALDSPQRFVLSIDLTPDPCVICGSRVADFQPHPPRLAM
jgi:NADH dehydrogenase